MAWSQVQKGGGSRLTWLQETLWTIPLMLQRHGPHSQAGYSHVVSPECVPSEGTQIDTLITPWLILAVQHGD